MRERMTTEDVDTITPQTIINIRPVVAALKEFFGSSQLSQFMHQTNSLDGLTHRRRLSALGAGGLTRERAPIEVRDVHPTHYGRMCPIETPEGPNIGLIGSLASLATVSEFGFIQTPYRGRRRRQGHRRDRLPRRTRRRRSTRSRRPTRRSTRRPASLHEHGPLPLRRAEAVMAGPKEIEFMDVSPAQIVSVATAMIPFLEHNDANRALMGANMQRQAVPLMITAGAARRHRPRVPRRASTRATCCWLERAGHGRRTRRHARSSSRADGTPRRVRPDEVHALEPGHADPPQADRASSATRSWPATVLADGSSTDHGELALGSEPARRVHAVRGLQLRGRDRPLRAARQATTCSPRSTSTSTRSTPARRSSATRRSRATSRTARRSRCATSTTAASSASAPRSARATCSSARSRRRARPS